MKQRSIALFVALAITVTACASAVNDDSAVTGTAGQRPMQVGKAVPASTSPDSGVASGAAPGTTVVPPAGGVATDGAAPAENPVTATADDALSTFAMDVDTGSYTLTRSSLRSGMIPDPAAVRTEEFVNAFAQDYPQPADGPFAITLDGTSAPFLAGGHRIVRVGIQGRRVADADRADANLTFVIDVSGSMAEPGKLDAVRPALQRLVESLRSQDRVAIVVYSDDTRVVLGSTPVSDRDTISAAIDSLQPEGSTNVEDGLRLGYTTAQESFATDRINRVILLSDGVANVGVTGPQEMLRVIGDRAREGIDLVTVGFGLGEYNDELMEQLADRGDGFYAYVDSEREAVRLFSEDLTGTLQTIARQAKVQVEFNPATVSSYRLVGFENRAVADDDFRDDRVDGGEIGSGHDVTALYDVTLAEAAGDDWLARVAIRWLDPGTGEASEASATLTAASLSTSLGEAPARLQQDVYVAAFAETLRGGPWGELISLPGLAENLHALGQRLGDERVAEIAGLVDARIRLG
jgi:Ca-activated chloride channel family protein